MNRNTQEVDSNEIGQPTLILAAKGKADDRIPRARAVDDLNRRFPDTFPLREKGGDWITMMDTDHLDGQHFVSKINRIKTDGEECPDCGNTRHLTKWWSNGVVGGSADICTVCNHEFSHFCG